MSWRYKGGFIQEFFNPLTVGPIDTFTLWSWGDNLQGALVQGDVIKRSSPIQVGGSVNWAQISSSYGSRFKAIKTDGTLWSGGWNIVGQVGDGTTVSRSSPVQVGALTTWSKVGGSNTASFAIRTDGTMWSWGANDYGMQGRNYSVTDGPSSPTQIGSLTAWASLSNSASGTMHAIKTDGTLWGWGYNSGGPIGDGTVVDRSSPVQIGSQTTWAYISDSNGFALALKTDNTMWSWGQASSGQLGQNSIIFRSSPVQIGALTTWSKISASYATCFAIKTDGTLWAWGLGGEGSLGNSDLISRSSPTQVGTLTTWSNVYGGAGNVVAIKTDGTLWAWGSNNSGELGQNNTTPRSSPVQIGTGTYWSQAAACGNSVFAIQSS